MGNPLVRPVFPLDTPKINFQYVGIVIVFIPVHYHLFCQYLLYPLQFPMGSFIDIASP